MDIPLLGMGTWRMGGTYDRNPSNIEESVEILRFGLDLGIRLIDVSELYGQGLTEEIVGQAIKGYPRDDIFLISKVWKTNLCYTDVLKSAEESLKRLGTDYLDLYLIHWPNEEVSLSETLKAMKLLLDQKLIRAIGISNFTAPLLKQTLAILDGVPLAALETEYSLSVRSAEQEIIPFCKDNNIHIIAYRPLSRGNLSIKSNYALATLAKKYQKTPTQVALNWIISQGFSAIPGSLNKDHLIENVGALGWNLSRDDVEFLRTSF